MEYPKINSLWKRDIDTNAIIEGKYSCPEFESQSKWRVQEKIDGTNVRIYLNDGSVAHAWVEFKGRTNKAVLPDKLIKFLSTIDFSEYHGSGPRVLFGEGFGAGIQSGGIYRPDISFILFDVYRFGKWAPREEVLDVSFLLGLETPHDYGLMTTEEIISFVKSEPHGNYGNKKYITEGIIARSEPLVRFNTLSANPVMWKLKVKDFNKK
jgi:hypothetical protein